jgi:hypothetical protein
MEQLEQERKAEARGIGENVPKVPKLDTNRKPKRRRIKRYGKDFCPGYGKPLSRPPTPSEITRFLGYCDTKTSPGHWLWTGHCDDKGYGQFWFDGKQVWSHRFSTQVFKGILQIGEQAAHDHDRCAFAGCVNPLCLGGLDISANTAEGNRRRKRERERDEPAPF